jgi:hypothetical protein
VACFLEPFAETGAGAVDEGADGGWGAMEDGGDFGGGELVDGGQEQGLAFEAGETFEFGEDGVELLGELEGVVGGLERGGELGGEGRVDLVGADAAAAIESEVPGDADEPDAEVADGGELGVVGFLDVLQDPDEGVLDGVFGFGGIAQKGVGDAEEQRSVGVHQRREVGFDTGVGQSG